MLYFNFSFITFVKNRHEMGALVQIRVDEKLYLKDPQDYKLGKKIIEQGVFLLDEIGIESFTFKKLAEQIGCTEATVYRYFTNKHNFLLYLLAWYWEWVRYRIDFNCMNVTDPKQKIKIVIKTIVDTVRLTAPAEYIDRDALQRVVISEGTKAYHTKEVDDENKNGFYKNFIYLNNKIASILLECKPKFNYPKTLATNLLEMANNQMFYAKHIPSLTEIEYKDDQLDDIEKMMEFFVFSALRTE